MKDQYNVLFLCTGNSARSIMAEAIMNFKGRPRFTAYSAGSHPSGKVRPEALQQLESARIPAANARSKSWDEFSQPNAPKVDFVFTVCDNAAKKVCPVWPGQPMTAHWGVPDPAAVTGSQEQTAKAYRDAFFALERRIGLFLNLPLASIDRLSLKREFGQDRPAMRSSLLARLTAEFVGTAFLLMAVVGSGIMGDRLAGGNVAIALLANTLATGAALVALILTFGPVSGGHFNPAVTLADAWQRGIAWSEVPGYLAAQVAGALFGVFCAHAMFALPSFSLSQHQRSGASQVFSEFIATFGLLAVIWGCSRTRASAVPYAVGAYITAAYWFTASTSFANPAVTLARAATNTFTGIRPSDVPGFLVAQIAGAAAATALFRWLVPTLPNTAKAVLVAHNKA